MLANLWELPLPFVVLVRLATLMSLFPTMDVQSSSSIYSDNKTVFFSLLCCGSDGLSQAGEVRTGIVVGFSVSTLSFRVVNTCCQKMAVLFAATEIALPVSVVWSMDSVLEVNVENVDSRFSKSTKAPVKSCVA